MTGNLSSAIIARIIFGSLNAIIQLTLILPLEQTRSQFMTPVYHP